MITSMESGWRYPLAAGLGLVAGGLLGVAIATLAALAMLREPLASFTIAEPWFLRWSTAELGANPAVLNSVWLLTLGPALAFAALGLVSAWRGALTDYDDAHFQTPREMKRNRMVANLEGNGFVYGKVGKPQSKGPYVSAAPDRFPHAIMIAPTGRGKNVGFVFPNLFHFQGSAVVLDVKGENFAVTSTHRLRALENDIWYFSPFDYVEGEGDQAGEALTRTHRFNPLARIAALPTHEQQYTAINTMTDLFLSVESTDAESFFQAGRSLFVAAALYAIETDKPTIGEALRIMNGGGNKKEAYRTIAAQTDIDVVREVFLGMADQIDKILDSYVSVIRGAGLQLWLDPAVDRATSASDFDFATFRGTPQTLYIAIQPEELKTLAPLVRLLFADAIASLQRARAGPGRAASGDVRPRRVRPARAPAERAAGAQDDPVLRRAVRDRHPVHPGARGALRRDRPARAPRGGGRPDLHDAPGRPNGRGSVRCPGPDNDRRQDQVAADGAAPERFRKHLAAVRGTPPRLRCRNPASRHFQGSDPARGPVSHPRRSDHLLRGRAFCADRPGKAGSRPAVAAGGRPGDASGPQARRNTRGRRRRKAPERHLQVR